MNGTNGNEPGYPENALVPVSYTHLLLQAYVTQENGRAKMGDVLFTCLLYTSRCV